MHRQIMTKNEFIESWLDVIIKINNLKEMLCSCASEFFILELTVNYIFSIEVSKCACRGYTRNITFKNVIPALISTRISWKADLNVSFYIELPIEDRISIIHYWVRRDTDRLFIGWFQKIFRRKIWSHMMCIYQWFIVENNPYWKCYKNRTWFITFES